eukprot:2780274-Pleurochrysis_carterae.AAC.1
MLFAELREQALALVGREDARAQDERATTAAFLAAALREATQHLRLVMGNADPVGQLPAGIFPMHSTS